VLGKFGGKGLGMWAWKVRGKFEGMWAWKVRGKFEGGGELEDVAWNVRGGGLLRCVGFCGSASWALI
jgi:hypothetical protein